jgi:hypothetical protein
MKNRLHFAHSSDLRCNRREEYMAVHIAEIESTIRLAVALALGSAIGGSADQRLGSFRRVWFRSFLRHGRRG